jgi:hypothetical protein
LTLAVAVIAPEDWKLPGKLYAAAVTPDTYRARLKAAEASLTDPKEWLILWGYHPLARQAVAQRSQRTEHDAFHRGLAPLLPRVFLQRRCHCCDRRDRGRHPEQRRMEQAG